MKLDLTSYEKTLLESAIIHEIDNLDSEIRVINKDMDFLPDDMFYEDNLLDLICKKEICQQRIYSYSELLNKIRREG